MTNTTTRPDAGEPGEGPHKAVAAAAANRVAVAVTLIGDVEMLNRGITDMLAPFSERIRVLEPGVGNDAGTKAGSFDLALFDCYPSPAVDGVVVGRRSPLAVDLVVAYSWDTRPELVKSALAQGFRGYLGKSLPGALLAGALERIAGGETVVMPQPRPSDHPVAVRWSGQEAGLTRREADVIALVTQGLSNQQVAARLFVSVNSVKSYIRSAYRKMDVTSRSQAVLWGLDHDFLPRIPDGETPDGR